MSKQKSNVSDAIIAVNEASIENDAAILELENEETAHVTVPPPNNEIEYVGKEQEDKTTVSEDSLHLKAKEAAKSLKELLLAIANKSKAMAAAKSQELKKMASSDGETIQDAKDIQKLGRHIETLDQIFEDTLSHIRQSPYEEQEKLLAGYKKLLQEEKYVINARYKLTRALAPLSANAGSEDVADQ
jgi:hypothetical protein